MGLNRYYVANLPGSGRVALSADEAHHACRVRRQLPGENAVLFDGRGGEASAVFVIAERRRAELEIARRVQHPPSTRPALTLLVGIPKGNRWEALISHCVELGVARLLPILTERSVRRPASDALDSWRRTAIESCKQCERVWGMEIDPPTDWHRALVEPSSVPRWIAHPYREGFHRDLPNRPEPLSALDPATDRQVAIGPEGGFTEEEVAAAMAAGWRWLELGTEILRVETAALAIAAWSKWHVVAGVGSTAADGSARGGTP